MKYRLRSPETTARPVSTQMWRDLLNGEYFKRLDGVNTNKRREEWLSIMDGLELPPDLGAVNHTMPSVDDAKKILWELFELNFRFELMALDSRMGGEIVPTRSTLELPRQEAIMDCFPASATGGHSLLVANHKAGDQGLAAEHWKDRAPFLVRLRDVMRPWVGSKPAELLELKPKTSYSETGILALENALASYYTQTFFQQFGRAAQIPYRLLTRT
jgi:hypothetical protein